MLSVFCRGSEMLNVLCRGSEMWWVLYLGAVGCGKCFM